MKSTSVRVYSGAPYERTVGYCRAIKNGSHIFVSGTTSLTDVGDVYAPLQAYLQAQRCFVIMERALKDLGGSLASVVRTRMFVTDIAQWQEFGRAHGEAFAQHPPATTMVQVQ